MEYDEPVLLDASPMGYTHVTMDVFETILDRAGVRKGTRDIVRDLVPPPSHNQRRAKANKQPPKEKS